MQQLPTILPPPELPDGTVPARSAERHANLVRFQAELEFVQCLANPLYLHELFAQKYLADPAFVRYLAYLEYWRAPEYVRFIVYPTALTYLSLLQTAPFRLMLGDMGFVSELARIGARQHETWRAEKGAAKTESETVKDETEH
ncbi:suppressor of hpr1 [Cryptotrichosporon argae]